jgi:hypothetical protein
MAKPASAAGLPQMRMSIDAMVEPVPITAQVPAVSAMVPPFNLSDAAKMRWFRNVPAGEPFDPAVDENDPPIRQQRRQAPCEGAFPHSRQAAQFQIERTTCLLQPRQCAE